MPFSHPRFTPGHTTSAPPFSLKGKCAVVTGAASGIGLAASEALAGAGAHVFILDLNKDDADKAAAAIRMQGLQATGMACNVADQAAVNSCFEEAARWNGRIDILVNNAGIAAVGSVLEATEAELDRLYSVNIKGVYFCAQADCAAFNLDLGPILPGMWPLAPMPPI